MGAGHQLIGSTLIRARLATAGERLRLSVRSIPAAPVTVTLTPSSQPAQPRTINEGEPGWFGGGAAPLLLELPVGETSIALSVPDLAPSDARYDVDVAVIDVSSGQVRTGRVYSLRWEFDAGSYLRLTNAAFYVRVPVGSANVVWQLSLAGLAGWQFQVLSNRIGVEPPSSARSVDMLHNRLLAEFEVYFEPPDVPLSGPADVTLAGVQQLADGLRVDRSSPGALSIDVDLDGDGVAPSSPRERLFLVRVPGGAYDVTLEWKDGLGQPIADGTYAGFATLATDEMHFTAVDVEYCLPGVRLFQLTPGGLVPGVMSWDDSAIDDGTIPRAFAQQVSSGLPAAAAVAGLNAHGWGGPLGNDVGPGNLTFIDTWAAGATTRVPFPVVIGQGQDRLPRRDGVDPSGTYVTPRPDAGVQPLTGVAPRPPGFTGGGGCSMFPAGPALLAALLWSRRRRHALALSLLSAVPGWAFDSEVVAPLRLSSSQPTLIGTEAGPSEVSLTTGYSRNAVLFAGTPVIEDLFSSSLSVAVRVIPELALEAGVGLLVAPASPANSLWHGARLTDALVGARWRLQAPGPLSFALHGHARIPTSVTVDFVGGSAGALGGATAQLDFASVRLALDLGGAALTGRRSQVRGQLAGSVKLVSSLWLGAECDVLAYVQPRDDVRAAVPLEARASVRWVGGAFRAGLIGSVGLTDGVGAPDARVMLSLSLVLPSWGGDQAPTNADEPAPREAAVAGAARRSVTVLVAWEGGAPALDAALAPSSGTCTPRGEGRFECLLAPGASVEARAPMAYPVTRRDSAAPVWKAVLVPEQPGFHVDATQASLDLDLFFDTASEVIRADAARRLERLAQRLRDRRPGLLILSAHADVRGGDRDNFLLSQRRGTAVMNYLRDRGVSLPMVVQPWGEREATVMEGSAADLEPDRRVHIGTAAAP